MVGWWFVKQAKDAQSSNAPLSVSNTFASSVTSKNVTWTTRSTVVTLLSFPLPSNIRFSIAPVSAANGAVEAPGCKITSPATFACSLRSYFTDYDDHFDDVSARGYLGDVAIWRQCGLAENFDADFAAAEGAATPPVFGFPPGGPKEPPNKLPTPKCTLLGVCPPPPPPGCTTPNCPPPPCQPDERRGRDGQCQPISCPAPSALIGGNCCQPGILATPGCSWCQSGQVSVGPSHSCCPAGQVYTGANGASACCSGQVVNGQCQPGTPNVPGNPQCQPGQTPPCCGAGYVVTGNICCLAGQATANGTCCPVGEIPVDDVCQPIHFTPPGPSCCAAGQTLTMNGQCCATANINTQGICCALPVNPQEPGSCPAQTQVVFACQPGYTRMPDKSCCLTSHVSHDGKTCEKISLPAPILPPVVRKRTIDCSSRGSRYIRNPNNPSSCIRCGRGMFANDDATDCIRPARPPPPREANCSARGPRYINNPKNPAVCVRCPPGMIANADATGCIRPARPPPPREANCSARGPRYINNPKNPAVCVRCPPGMIANADADGCVRVAPPPGVYGPPDNYGPPPVWGGPRRGGRGGFGRPPRPRGPPRGFRPGPFRPGGVGFPSRTF